MARSALHVEKVPHVEWFFAEKDGDPIGVRCFCAIAQDHDHDGTPCRPAAGTRHRAKRR